MAKGRLPSKGEAYWRRVIQRQAASGGTIRDFCRRNRLREPTFYFWRRELLRRDAASQRCRDDERPAAGETFVAVSVRPEPVETAARENAAGIEAGRIDIILPAGHLIRVTHPVDRQALADVLAVLEARPC